MPRFYLLNLSHGLLLRFLRFRLGCHHLRINTGRWQEPPLPRSERLCLRCSMSATVDDEAHCVWECRHPTLVDYREDLLAALQAALPTERRQLFTFSNFWSVVSRLEDLSLQSWTVRYIALCCRVASLGHAI